MQLRHGDNLGNGFGTNTRAYITALVPSALVLWFVCTCACAKLIPEIVPHGEIKHSHGKPLLEIVEKFIDECERIS